MSVVPFEFNSISSTEVSAESADLNLSDTKAYLPNNLESILEIGEKQLSFGHSSFAAQIFWLILKMDPNNEQALRGLCRANGDLWQNDKVNLNFESSGSYPENNERAEKFPQRIGEFSDFTEVIKGSFYLKLWESYRENRFDGGQYLNLDKKDSPIKQIGTLLVELGYLTDNQLQEALDLQMMLRNLGANQQLGKMLVEAGFVTQKQVDEILQLQDKAFQIQKAGDGNSYAAA